MGHVEAAHLSHMLPDGRVLLDDVSFRVGDGLVAALVGPNGAGKTTLLRLVTGDLTAQSGTISSSGGLGVMRQFVGGIRDELHGAGPAAVGIAPARPGRRGAAGRGRAGHDGARRRADPDAVRPGADRVGRRRRLRRRGALGRLLRGRPGRQLRPLPVARGAHPVRRRAEAAGAGVAAARQGRGAAARRARQLPGRARQDLAGAAARRHLQDRPAGQPRPGAAGRLRPADHHRRGQERLGARRRVRHLRAGPPRAQRPPGRAAPALGRGAREAQAARADVPAESRLQRRHGLPAAGRRHPAAQVRGGGAAGAGPARAERADAAARRPHRQARRDLRAAGADRADAPLRPGGLVRRARRRAGLQRLRASRTSCACWPGTRSGTRAWPGSGPGWCPACSPRPTPGPISTGGRRWRS